MENISFDKVKIKKSMWYDLQKINGEKTINSVRNRFAETGRFDAFKCDWKEGMDKKPHFFWDSDVAKWIEGVAYIVTGNRNDELEKYVDDLVDLVEKNQHKNGYFNIFYTVCDPGKEWTQRKNHELYCAGHLIEAAIAYKKATKKDKLLKCMIKYADYIYKVFVEEKSASFVTCGHEEIELALVRLFYETNNKKYLDLAQFFIDMRGNNDKDFNADVSYEERAYDQSHLPVRKQFTAEGHAVRGCYLYSAMADLAKINSDKELFDACKSIFNNITEKRMYVTGGIGSSRIKEAFTIDYDLPNQYAYSESCAAISLAMFANRMLKLENNRIYSDIIEKIWLYARTYNTASYRYCALLQRPDCISKIGKASLDLQRLSNEVSALLNAKSDAGILFSQTSRMYNLSSINTAYNIFTSLLNIGKKAEFIPESQIKKINDYKILFIPGSTHITKETLNEIYNYSKNGGKVVIFNDNSFKYSEQNILHDENTVSEIYKNASVYKTSVADSGIVLLSPSYEEFSDAVRENCINAGLSDLKIVNKDTGEIVKSAAAEMCQYEGSYIVNLTDYDWDDKNITLVIDGKNVEQSYDLIAMEELKDGFVLKGYTPRLIKIAK